MSNTLRIHGSATAVAPALDRPHPGRGFAADFDAAFGEFDPRDGEGCYVDELYLPATEPGVPLPAVRFPRTHVDPNRHRGDVDPALIEGGRAIYARILEPDGLLGRILRCHAPYHAALRELIAATHAHSGVVHHVNRHSMPAADGKQGEGGAGKLDQRLRVDEATRDNGDGFATLQKNIATLAEPIGDYARRCAAASRSGT